MHEWPCLAVKACPSDQAGHMSRTGSQQKHLSEVCACALPEPAGQITVRGTPGEQVLLLQDCISHEQDAGHCSASP